MENTCSSSFRGSKDNQPVAADLVLARNDIHDKKDNQELRSLPNS